MADPIKIELKASNDDWKKLIHAIEFAMKGSPVFQGDPDLQRFLDLVQPRISYR